MEAGQLWFPAEAPYMDVVRRELLEFPNGSHDDIVDVTSMAAGEMLRLYEGGGVYKGQLITSAEPLPENYYGHDDESWIY
jgi:hypothetical protein